MGFHNLDHLSPRDQICFNRFLQDDFTPIFFKTKPMRAYVLLLSFRKVMR